MKKVQVCAIVDRSAGNESVGSMWVETAVFPESAKLSEVLNWAGVHRVYPGVPYGGENPKPEHYFDFTRNIRLALVQDPKEGTNVG